VYMVLLQHIHTLHRHVCRPPVYMRLQHSLTLRLCVCRGTAGWVLSLPSPAVDAARLP
jgi:hypothetical protein